MKKLLKGSLSISRVYGANEGWVSITLQDELSGSQCVEIKISPENFGNAVTGASCKECEFEFRPSVVGMKAEYKEEIIPRPRSYDMECSKLEAAELIKPYEVDGWKGSVTDATNHHRWVGLDKVKVGFTRHVTV